MVINLLFHAERRTACSMFMVIAMAMLLFAAPTHARENTPPHDNRLIRSAAEIEYPPFSIVDKDGTATGFSVELLRAALSAMNRGVSFRTGTWSEAREWLRKGEVQALPLVGRTPERESIFDFTFPYMSLHGAIVVRNDATGIENIEDLKGLRVAVMKGDNAEEFLRRRDRGIRIRTTPTFEAALRGLSNGGYDAVVIQRLVALRLIGELGLHNLKVLNKPVRGFRQDFCFAVTEGDKDTLALLNEGLSIVMADGTYRHLHAKWFAALQLPQKQKIVVGGDHNYPPFEYLDEEGNPTGFNVAITKAVASEVGLDVQIRLGPWAKIREELAEGRIDAIQGMLYSPERDLTFDFTQPYTVNHYVSVVRKGEGPAPDTVAGLRGRRIVVQKGDIMHDFALENNLGERIVSVDSQEDALQALAAGKHDCALVARLTALYWIEKRGWENLRIAKHALLSPGYGFAVPHNQKALLAKFSEGLKILENSRKLQKIRENWLGVYKEMPPSFSEILHYIAIIVIPLILLLSVFLLWSWSLRKQVAARTRELQKSEEQYRLLADNTLDVIWILSPDLVFTYVNPAITHLTGYQPEEWIGSRLADHCEKAGFQRMRRILEQEIDNGPEFGGVVFETEILAKNGRPISVEIHGKVIFDKNRAPIKLQGVTRDITKRKEAEDRLKESEKRFRLLVESAPEAIFIQVDEKFAYLNPQAVTLFGADSAEDLLDTPVLQRFHPDYHEMAKERIRILNQEKQPVERIEEVSVKIDDTPVDVEVSAVPFRYRGKNGALVFMRDITEQKKTNRKQKELEKQLELAQRVEAVGRLAGGVAHDFNNLLYIILGYGEMMLENMEKDDAHHEPMAQIYDAGIKARNLTRQLLAFSRKQVLEMARADVNEIVSGLSKLLRRVIGEDVELELHLTSDPLFVMVDTAQLEQVLMNLAVNARDAMPEGGLLTIGTAAAELDAAYAAGKPHVTPGLYAMITVSDTGTGMDSSTKDSIFEPFFTTKEGGKGTGLGLATCYGIVKQHNGNIWVYSEPGAGTTFKVYLPLAAEPYAEPYKEKEKIPGEKAVTLTGDETVLVVEDDPAVRKLTSGILRKHGYNVLESEDVYHAIELSQKHEASIHLMIVDVIMPRMKGPEVYETISGDHPETKVLYMSGYTDNVIAHHGILEAGIQFIQKPFSASTLAAKVREVLDQSRSQF